MTRTTKLNERREGEQKAKAKGVALPLSLFDRENWWVSFSIRHAFLDSVCVLEVVSSVVVDMDNGARRIRANHKDGIAFGLRV